MQFVAKIRKETHCFSLFILFFIIHFSRSSGNFAIIFIFLFILCSLIFYFKMIWYFAHSIRFILSVQRLFYFLSFICTLFSSFFYSFFKIFSLFQHIHNSISLLRLSNTLISEFDPQTSIKPSIILLQYIHYLLICSYNVKVSGTNECAIFVHLCQNKCL